ncbi:carbohydrate-binding module family 12 protein [Jaapia argillacea MUCL 33604]|uniref:Carbohydrate-binding module family 12 protein n=1 Tax=Jaapia argillacea MUCL 33604 TaxID=933084 RepID=A0A067Q2E7_9AGAM|nr:carbohydrate-binding module family 12 protein [Jaapia argillacea MUCL 33604]
MVACWEPGTQYNLGDVVEYEGHQYKIIQPHRSQGDWTPPCTPALWGRCPDNSCQGGGGYQPSYQQPPPEQQQQPLQPQQAPYAPDKPWDDHKTQHVDIPHDEQKKNWFDLDDERKKQLEVGGGLVAGLAAIGGGFMAYKAHEKSEEQKKAAVWALQAWLKDAQARTEAFHRDGPRGPTTWVLNQGHVIPQGAIQGGEENGKPLFIARAFHDGAIMLGKASPNLKKGGAIGYKKEEIPLDTYEILLGNPQAVRWVQAAGKINVASLGARPVEGGKEDNGEPLYIAQAPYKGNVVVGKASAVLDGAYVTYNGGEVKVKEYRVLCYA